MSVTILSQKAQRFGTNLAHHFGQPLNKKTDSPRQKERLWDNIGMFSLGVNMARFSNLFHRQSAGFGLKKNIMHPLVWMLGISFSTSVGLCAWGAPTWLLVCMAVFSGIILIANLVVYGFFMFMDPDRLQSEHYQLSKAELAIEDKNGRQILNADTAELTEEPKTIPALPAKEDD